MGSDVLINEETDLLAQWDVLGHRVPKVSQGCPLMRPNFDGIISPPKLIGAVGVKFLEL